MSCLHRGPYVQRGRGFGSTLSAMFKGVIPAAQLMGKQVLASPLTKTVVKAAKRSARDAGLQLANDLLHGKQIKNSLKENVVSTAKRAVKKSLRAALTKEEVPSIPSIQYSSSDEEEEITPRKKKKARRGKKKSYSDIFEENFA
jgi:hypothetical protein